MPADLRREGRSTDLPAADGRRGGEFTGAKRKRALRRQHVPAGKRLQAPLLRPRALDSDEADSSSLSRTADGWLPRPCQDRREGGHAGARSISANPDRSGDVNIKKGPPRGAAQNSIRSRMLRRCCRRQYPPGSCRRGRSPHPSRHRQRYLRTRPRRCRPAPQRNRWRRPKPERPPPSSLR